MYRMGYDKKTSIPLSGSMIGSTLFAVPKRPKVGNAWNSSENVTDNRISEVFSWHFARTDERSESEVLWTDGDGIFTGDAVRRSLWPSHGEGRNSSFPSRKWCSRNVSFSVGALRNPRSRAWRETIVDYMSGFKSGGTDIATIESKMFNFLDEAESGEIVFDNHASHMLMLGLVLYELERLIGNVRWVLVSEVKKHNLRSRLLSDFSEKREGKENFSTTWILRIRSLFCEKVSWELSS